MQQWPQLHAVLRRFDAMGWLLGTCGNFSLREEEDFWLSRSGVRKGEMQEGDFLRIAVKGVWPPGNLAEKPSAEGSLHQVIYQILPEVTAVVHAHSPSATLAGKLVSNGGLQFDGVEMLKGFNGIDPLKPQTLRVFKNHPVVEEIAQELCVHLESPGTPPAMLIEGHGVTAWGVTVDEACRHFEIAEFLCRYHLEQARLGGAA